MTAVRPEVIDRLRSRRSDGRYDVSEWRRAH